MLALINFPRAVKYD
uniref:Uncharacterized protein n=1 Tax=Anguilla anguilla TaxID=7936 RepID=A0A0E9WPE8_ANGAN